MLLAGLSAVGPFSTDTYLPSFPEIERLFGVAPVVMQQTLTAYMIPFAIMTLWHGAISDTLGRRRVTLALLAVFVAASIGCACAWNIGALLAFRALQGMAAGAGMVIGRAVVRDVLDGAEARRLMSHVALVFALAPSVGPVVGGWLQVWFGWRSVFVFLALFAALMWTWCFVAMPETLPPHRRQPLHLGNLLRGYGQALGSLPFVSLAIGLTLNFSAVFIYIISAPVFLMDQLHVGATGFIWLFGPITCGILGGTWISSHLAGTLSSRRTVALGYGIMAVAALGNVAFNFWHAPALPWSVLPVVVYVMGNSIAAPCLTLMALDLFPERRGLAASCQSFAQSSGNALVTAIIAPLVWGTALHLALGMLTLLALGLAGFVIYEAMLRSARRTPAPAATA